MPRQARPLGRLLSSLGSSITTADVARGDTSTLKQPRPARHPSMPVNERRYSVRSAQPKRLVMNDGLVFRPYPLIKRRTLGNSQC
jgi:hypothetical protein